MVVVASYPIAHEHALSQAYMKAVTAPALEVSRHLLSTTLVVFRRRHEHCPQLAGRLDGSVV